MFAMKTKERLWSILAAICFGGLLLNQVLYFLETTNYVYGVQTLVYTVLVVTFVINRKNVVAGLGTGFYAIWYLVTFFTNATNRGWYLWFFMAAAIVLLYVTVAAGQPKPDERDVATVTFLWPAPWILALVGFVLYLISALGDIPLSQWLYALNHSSTHPWHYIGAEIIEVLGFVCAGFWIRNSDARLPVVADAEEPAPQSDVPSEDRPRE